MQTNNIAVVVATGPRSGSEAFSLFLEAWREQFTKHAAMLVVVGDGESPMVRCGETTLCVSKVMRADGSNFSDLIFNRNSGVSNLGLAFIARFLPAVDVIVTLDENALPEGDTIGDHLHTLQRRESLSWLATSPRDIHGIPDAVRSEAPVVVSHGITRSLENALDATFYTGPIPRSVYAPIQGTNLAFRREVLEYVYFAPMGPRVGMDGFADIWMGIFLKRALDATNRAIYSGGATVCRERSSRLPIDFPAQKRARHLNETLWQGEETDSYFTLYAEKRERWTDFCSHAGSDAATLNTPITKYGPGASVISASGVQPPGHVRPYLPESHEKGSGPL